MDSRNSSSIEKARARKRPRLRMKIRAMSEVELKSYLAREWQDYQAQTNVQVQAADDGPTIGKSRLSQLSHSPFNLHATQHNQSEASTSRLPHLKYNQGRTYQMNPSSEEILADLTDIRRPIQNLLRYLSYGGDISSYMEMAAIFHWAGPPILLKLRTCFLIFCHVIKFLSSSKDFTLCTTILHLNDLIEETEDVFDSYMDNIAWTRKNPHNRKGEKFCALFIYSFMPQVLDFFRVPELRDENCLKQNESLACFIDFLLQILDSESHCVKDKEQWCTVLRKKLTYLLAFLGDKPFMSTEFEDAKNILSGFEILANDSGSFIYSFVYPHQPIDSASFDALLIKFRLLNAGIKEHCIKFSDLSTTSRESFVDSSFILGSRIEDLEKLINSKSIKYGQLGTFHEELTSSRAFINVIREGHGATSNDGLEESLVIIADAIYEAEYLINSHFLGTLPT